MKPEREVTPNTDHYARFILEKVLMRQRYTGLTLMDMMDAIEQILNHSKDPGNVRTSNLAFFIRARKDRNKFPRKGDTRV